MTNPPTQKKTLCVNMCVSAEIWAVPWEDLYRILCKPNEVEPHHAPGGWGLGAV